MNRPLSSQNGNQNGRAFTASSLHVLHFSECRLPRLPTTRSVSSPRSCSPAADFLSKNVATKDRVQNNFSSSSRAAVSRGLSPPGKSIVSGKLFFAKSEGESELVLAQLHHTPHSRFAVFFGKTRVGARHARVACRSRVEVLRHEKKILGSSPEIILTHLRATWPEFLGENARRGGNRKIVRSTPKKILGRTVDLGIRPSTYW